MNPILFSGRSNPGLGRKLSAALGLEEGRCLIEDFADGEIRIEVKQAVAGSHVVILQSTAAPAGQNLLELLLLADAIRRRGARTKLNEVEQLADPLLAYLQAVKGVKRVVIAGSYRRRKETVGDLDVLVTCKSDSPVMSRFTEFEDVVEVLSSGKTKSSVRLRGGLQVDLRVVPEVSYGAALYYFTGSKEHNIAVRKIAVGKGLKINEYGVFQGKGDDEERIAGASEEDIFKTVGLRYIEPELRENHGEIEAAQQSNLPQL
ncbi:MAG: ribose-phosphate pyrophosphokinase-like domain-containing protein, partial [Desulfuromonadales bacterium]